MAVKANIGDAVGGGENILAGFEGAPLTLGKGGTLGPVVTSELFGEVIKSLAKFIGKNGPINISEAGSTFVPKSQAPLSGVGTGKDIFGTKVGSTVASNG